MMKSEKKQLVLETLSSLKQALQSLKATGLSDEEAIHILTQYLQQSFLNEYLKRHRHTDRTQILKGMHQDVHNAYEAGLINQDERDLLLKVILSEPAKDDEPLLN